MDAKDTDAAGAASQVLLSRVDDGVLRLTQVGAGPQMGVSETVNVLRLSGFSFDRRAFTGAYTRVFPWLSFPFSQILGTYEMVRRDADN